MYSKCCKILKTLFHPFLAFFFCFLYNCFLKYLVGMANSVDPDQTAP